MMELICIVCPKGCRLMVDEDNGYAVTGNGCARGMDYGVAEVKDPRRVYTGTVAVTNAAVKRLPVKSDRPIPKGLMLAAAQALKKMTVSAPVSFGDVICRDVLSSGADIISCANATPPQAAAGEV